MKDNYKISKTVLDGYLLKLYRRARARWVQWMSRHSQRLGRRGLMIVFGVFTTMIAAGCAMLIFAAGTLLRTSPSISPYKIISIRAPDTTRSPKIVRDTLLQQQLSAFRRYMAELEKSEAGRKTRDSLLRARPGLIDSIAIAETLYTNQN
jgi:hypothetical protein